MRNPLINGRKLKSPCSYSGIQNPLTNHEKVKRLKKQHAENLRAAGVHLPKSPLK